MDELSNDGKTLQKTDNFENLLTKADIEKIIFMYTEQNYSITDISLKIYGSVSGVNRDKVSKTLKQAGIEIKNRGGRIKESIIDLSTATALKSNEMAFEQLDKLNQKLKDSPEPLSPSKILQIQMIGRQAMDNIKDLAAQEEVPSLEIDKELLDEGILERLRDRSDGRDVIDEEESEN